MCTTRTASRTVRNISKKMTQADFQKWTDYAIVLRNMALDREIEYDECVQKYEEVTDKTFKTLDIST